MLIDEITITVKAGNGGNGAVHFKRNAQTAKGGPDGGNGGDGGNVYVIGVNDVLGLSEFQFKKNIQAEAGVGGGRQNLFGRRGKDTILKIPIGTYITDTKSGEEWEIEDETTKILIAKGGKGGRGNNEFKSATDQTPYFAENGKQGIERKLHLELKLIADIGFIGLPNAGKSSLLKELTNAKPKIGDYPFTTLEPNLGVLPDSHIILADIPGLIEGASKGKGLGIKFLRHVEKTKLLIHCIDVTNEDCIKTYHTVRKELTTYSNMLAQKPEVILLTKTDLVDKIVLGKKLHEIKKLLGRVFTVSIYDKDSVSNLHDFIVSSCNKD